MSMHIPILASVQNVRISRWRNGHILIKNLLLKHIFQDKDHLYGNSLFYVVSIYCKCLLSQLLIRGVRMHIPILTGVKNERISKNAKITHILSIGFFQLVWNCCFRNITKIIFSFFAYVAFLYISIGKCKF